MKATSEFTYELIVWVHAMELTLQIRAGSTQDANRLVLKALGRTAIIVTGPTRIDGATSAAHMRAIATTPAHLIPAQ